MHATILNGIVGGFEFSFSQRNLKELARKAMEMCLRVLKESNKSRFDSYSRQEQCIAHIPYHLSGLSRTFFPTTFLDIAVYLDAISTTFKSPSGYSCIIFIYATTLEISEI